MGDRRTWERALVAVSLGSALALVAQSELRLALAVGWPPAVAWLAPVALDAYALAAVVVRRDLGPAVLVSALSVFASHALYAAPGAWPSGAAGDGHLLWWLAAGASVVPLLVAWRVHGLITAGGRVLENSGKTTGDSTSPEVESPVVETGPVARTAPRSKPVRPTGGGSRAAAVEWAADVHAASGVWPTGAAVVRGAGVSKSTAHAAIAEARAAAGGNGAAVR